ncbi:MAG TPA: exosome complex RNA-binding protein Rrp4 [Candidatus Thermoplasmatota archaeon]|nr:exosome complex RNA-binding protein Rrp4 [Candidatus Thermoplasmatota archaeon]
MTHRGQQVRELVVPGELLDDTGRLKPGFNTYREGGSVFATRLGLKEVRGDRVSVIQLSGRYEPMRGDFVIGTVVENGPSNWYITVGAPQDVGMHVNDVPWRVEFGETSKYLAVGDTVLLRVVHVDELRKVQVSMKDRQCRKLEGGITLDISPSKVPRVIGRQGSMISMIKDMTNTRMLVGQNGVIWIDGAPQDIAVARRAIETIEAEAHTSGLTDRIRKLLEDARGRSYEEVRAERESERRQSGEDEGGDGGEPEGEEGFDDSDGDDDPEDDES